MRFAATTLLFLLTASSISARITQTLDYPYQQPLNATSILALALTPDHDALTLVATTDAQWILTRVRGWIGGQPVSESLRVPGFAISARDANALRRRARPSAFYTANLFVTDDGRYAICVAAESPH